MKMDYIEKMVNRCGVILNTPKPNVELHEFDSDEISAIFILSTYTILVNTLWLDSANPIEIFITICHEMRHAYQFYRVNNDKVTNDNKVVIQKWKEEFDNYCYPQDERFLEQKIYDLSLPICTDLGERTVIPDNIKKKVYLRIQQITETLEG